MTPTDPRPSLLLALAKRIRARVRRDGGDADIEQAWLRVAINIIGFIYVCFLISKEGSLTAGLLLGMIASSGDALVGAGAIWWLRKSRKHVIPLRYLAIASDNVALTLGMAGAGEAGVAMIGVYLWVTIGNGFRFGPRFLLTSYWLSIVGFTLQLALVPFWQQHLMIGAGLLISLAVVPLYVLILIIRLTRQKEAAEQLSNAKSRFVANVSHELRTPLTGVFAVYDLMRARKRLAEDRELVAMLGSAVKTLKTSVDAVLQMSKLEAGAERAERRLFNLWFFMQQVSEIVRPQSAAKRLSWSLQVDPATPTAVLGDPNHLSHVLGNLLNNAFKFTPSGGVTLRVFPLPGLSVRFEVSDTGVGIPLDQQERLFERFVQVDNSATRKFGGTGLGTSISRDLTELMGGKIGVVSAPGQGSTFWVEVPLERPTPDDAINWEPRTKIVIEYVDPQVAIDLAHTVRSLGVDVSMVNLSSGHHTPPDSVHYFSRILAMSAQHASLRLEQLSAGLASCPILVASTFTSAQRASLAAGGASAILSPAIDSKAFKLTLSSLVNRLEIPNSEDSDALLGRESARSLRILLADDNASNQLLLSKILKNAGHSVTTADSGASAFEAMSEDKLDLALLDLNMPDMSGPDVIALYRAGSVGAIRLPIVVLSADATPAAKQQSLEAGADEFLTKPVTATGLLAVIDRLMNGSVSLPDETPGPGTPLKAETGYYKDQGLIDADRIAALHRIGRGDQKFVETYLTASFSEIESAIAALRAAIDGSDIRSSRDAIHILEGTGSSIGAVALVHNCKSMRNMLSTPSNPRIATALAELSTTYALTKSTIQASVHEKLGWGAPSRPVGR